MKRNVLQRAWMPGVCLSLIATATLHAGSFVADFNDGLVPPNSAVHGTAFVDASGGVDGSGVLKLTIAQNSQSGSFIIEDLDGGALVAGFTAAFKARVGGGSATPADGFSFNWATDLPNGAFPQGEEGAGTGLTVAFDIFDNGNDEAPAIDVKFGGFEIATTKLSIEQIRTGDDFVDVLIELQEGGVLNLVYNGMVIYDQLPISGFTPLAGARFGFAARTGGLNENHWIDEISIETQVMDQTFIESFGPTGQSVRADAAIMIRISDSPFTAAVNANSIQLSHNWEPVTPVILQENGITIVFYDPPGLLPFASTHSVNVNYWDTLENFVSHDYEFTVVPSIHTSHSAFSPDQWPSTSDPEKTVHFVSIDSTLEPLSDNWKPALHVATGHDQPTEPITIGGFEGLQTAGSYLNIADTEFQAWADEETIDILVQVYGNSALFSNGEIRDFQFLIGSLPELNAPLGGRVPVDARNSQWNWFLFRIPNPANRSDGSRYVGSIPPGSAGANQYGGVNGGTIRFENVPGIVVRLVAFGQQGAFGEPEDVNWFQPPPPPELAVGPSDVTISWPSGGLQVADEVAGPWSEIINAVSPRIEPLAPQKFFRLRPF